MKERRVVVTGIGALTPLGNNLQDYWSSLVGGVSGAAPITRFDATKFKTQFACEVKGFDASEFIHKKEARKLDRFSQYALVVSEEAIQDSQIDLKSIDGDRAGVIWGSGIGGMETFFNESVNFGKGSGEPRFNPFFIPKLISDIPAGHISIKYNFRGPNFTTVSACASSTNALIDAFNYIKFNKADLFVAGGSEACIYPPGIGGFNAMMALSTRNENPKKIRNDILSGCPNGMEIPGRDIAIRKAIKLSSVFVLLSYNEGTPRSVLEAMAMGRPIITSNAVGCKETVEDGKNGLILKKFLIKIIYQEKNVCSFL